MQKRVRVISWLVLLILILMERKLKKLKLFLICASLIIALDSNSQVVRSFSVAKQLLPEAFSIGLRARPLSTWAAAPHHAECVGEVTSLSDIADVKEALYSSDRLFFNPAEMREKKYHSKLPEGFGIWFRGVNNPSFQLIPGVHRLSDALRPIEEQERYLDETAMFTEYRLKSPDVHHVFNNPDLHRSVDNIMSWLTLMQHYGLPTRLLDWTADIKIALFFGASGAHENGGKLHVLNAARLNNYVLKERGFGVSPQDDLAVSLRAELSLATQLEDLLGRKTIFEHESFMTHMRHGGDPREFLSGLGMPISVEARRYNPRIVSQQGFFTIHGGKIFPPRMETNIPQPKTLEALNYEAVKEGFPPFLISFLIKDPERILRELHEQKITEEVLLGRQKGSMLKEMKELADQLKERWTLEPLSS